jgi:hypothetical protein
MRAGPTMRRLWQQFQAREAEAEITVCLEERAQRAEEQLLKSLSPHQRQTWVGRGYFDLISSRGHPWRIRRAMTGNATRLNYGDRYCAILVNPGCPLADHILAVALTLRTNENAFLRVAIPM